jgi:hypothetical protein
MVNDDSDESLGTRLDSALRAGLDSDQVDVATLLQGTRRRAKRVRTRRTAAVTAVAALVLAVPVGYELLNPQPGATAPPAMILPSSSGSAGARTLAPTARPNPTAAASAVPPSGPVTPALDLAVTGSTVTGNVASLPFTATELPAGLDPTPRLTLNTGEVLVAGQDCGRASSTAVPDPRPVAGWQWLWSPGPKADAGRRISLTVTGWAAGDAAIAVKNTIAGTGHCRWESPQKPYPLTGFPSEESWASTSSDAGHYSARAIVRIGDGIAGIEVQDPDGTAAAAKIANRLAAIEAARLAHTTPASSP